MSIEMNLIVVKGEDMGISKTLSIHESDELYFGDTFYINDILYKISHLRARNVFLEPLRITTDTDITTSDEITCPRCLDEQEDSWEAEDSGVWTCESCGAEYSYEREITVSYYSKIEHVKEAVVLD